MKQDPLNTCIAKVTYLQEWFTNLKAANAIAPDVNRQLDQAKWCVYALSDRPAGSENIPEGTLQMAAARDLESLRTGLPMIPVCNSSALSSVVPSSASAAYAALSYVEKHRDLGTPEAEEYVSERKNAYYELQAVQSLPNVVRRRLEKFGNSKLLDLFDKAQSAYATASAGIQERTAAGIALRNLLDQFKGQLWENARDHERENITWETMAERLAVAEPRADEYHLLLAQESEYRSLIADLSSVAKERSGSVSRDLKEVWFRLMNHLNTVQDLIVLCR